MPKVQYTNAKGLFQQAGTGIAVANDAIITARDIAFMCGYDPAGMTTTAVVDAEMDNGEVATNNLIIDSAWVGGSTCAVTLPAATVGAYFILRQTAAVNDTNAITFTCAGTDKFQEDQVVSAGTSLAALVDVSASDDIKLVITPHGSNGGWSEIGSSVHFYCREAGKWLVKIHGVPKGTGASGTIAFANS